MFLLSFDWCWPFVAQQPHDSKHEIHKLTSDIFRWLCLKMEDDRGGEESDLCSYWLNRRFLSILKLLLPWSTMNQDHCMRWQWKPVHWTQAQVSLPLFVTFSNCNKNDKFCTYKALKLCVHYSCGQVAVRSAGIVSQTVWYDAKNVWRNAWWLQAGAKHIDPLRRAQWWAS